MLICHACIPQPKCNWLPSVRRLSPSGDRSDFWSQRPRAGGKQSQAQRAGVPIARNSQPPKSRVMHAERDGPIATSRSRSQTPRNTPFAHSTPNICGRALPRAQPAMSNPCPQRPWSRINFVGALPAMSIDVAGPLPPQPSGEEFAPLLQGNGLRPAGDPPAPQRQREFDEERGLLTGNYSARVWWSAALNLFVGDDVHDAMQRSRERCHRRAGKWGN